MLTVRQKGPSIFGLNPKYFDTNFDRASVMELQQLLKLPGDTGYSPLAPILFTKYRYDTTMKSLFKNDVLVDVSYAVPTLQYLLITFDNRL